MRKFFKAFLMTIVILGGVGILILGVPILTYAAVVTILFIALFSVIKWWLNREKKKDWLQELIDSLD